MTETTLPTDRGFVAIDLGAESCRVSLLTFEAHGPSVRLVHRCDNGPVAQPDGSLRWDLPKLLQELLRGLKLCESLAPAGVASIGVDGWSVDYVRLGPDGRPIGLPFSYRDDRTVAAETSVAEKLAAAGIDADQLFALTGTAPGRINTLYQLHADAAAGVAAETPWVMLPEYILMWLGGRRVAEKSNAAHTQLLGLVDGRWCEKVFAAAGLSTDAAPPVVPAGTVVGMAGGPLSGNVWSDTKLIAPVCHDTASAVAGLADDSIYLSSGTWSLIGASLPAPVATPQTRLAGFTNLAGVGESFLFHQGVGGMWLVRQCMLQWQAEGTSWSIVDLVEAAAKVPTPAGLIDVDSPDMLAAGDMPQRINGQRAGRGLAPVVDPPALARLIFASLAERYRRAIDDVSRFTGKSFATIRVVGGGSRNGLLNQMTRDATGLAVIPGVAESSTLGNFAVQLAALETPSDPGVSSLAVAAWAAKIAPAFE